MDAITFEKVLDFVFLYTNLPTYFVGAIVMFFCFLFGSYVSNSFKDQEGIDGDDFLFSVFASFLWPFVVIFFTFFAIDRSFTFFAKIITSKWK